MEEKLNRIVGNLNVRGYLSATLRELNNIYIEESILLRGIYLSNLFYQDFSGFFDMPKIDVLLKAIYSKPKRLFIHFLPTFVQAFSSQVSLINENPIPFAEETNEYFKKDISEIMHFSYSLFPTIFGYFSNDDFLTSAYNFIEYMVDNSDKSFSFELVNSILLSATSFYDMLWKKLSFNISLPKMSEKRLQRGFIKALRQTCTVLCPQYCKVLRKIIEKYGEEGYSFIILRIFLAHFNEQVISSQLFHDDKNTENFSAFLKKQGKCCNKEMHDAIDNMIDETNHLAAPSIGELSSKTPISLIVCEKDMRLFVSIVDEKNKVFSHCKYHTLTDSLDPFLFELFPYVTTKDTSKIFNVQIDYKLPKEESPEQLKSWKIVNDYADQKNITLYEAVSYIGDHFPDKKEYLRNKLLKIYKSKFNSLELTMKYQESVKRVENNMYTITNELSVMIYKISQKIMRNIIKNDKDPYIMNRLKKAITTIVGKNDIPKDIVFTITCCALDCLNVVSGDFAKTINDKFAVILTKWVRTVKNASFGVVASLLPSLYDISYTGYGKRLMKIIDFMHQFEVVYGSDLDDKWFHGFRAIMSSISDESIFSTFIFLHHFIFRDNFFHEKCIGNARNSWLHFSTGIFSIAQDNEEFLTLISNPTTCASMFSILAKNCISFIK